uniref:Uncharacterized protein n=1 Tax=Tetranychus urticae TaxID=32264 RepID=T1KAN3_TETUR
MRKEQNEVKLRDNSLAKSLLKMKGKNGSASTL